MVDRQTRSRRFRDEGEIVSLSLYFCHKTGDELHVNLLYPTLYFAAGNVAGVKYGDRSPRETADLINAVNLVMKILRRRHGIRGDNRYTQRDSLSGSADRRDNALTRYKLQEYQMNAFTVSIFLCPIQICGPFSLPWLPFTSRLQRSYESATAISLLPGTTDADAMMAMFHPLSNSYHAMQESCKFTFHFKSFIFFLSECKPFKAVRRKMQDFDKSSYYIQKRIEMIRSFSYTIRLYEILLQILLITYYYRYIGFLCNLFH